MSARRRRAPGLPPDASRIPRDVGEEVTFHLEEKVRRLVAEGMSEEEAWREARRRFGNRDQVEGMMRREQEKRLAHTWWDDLRQDVGYALRTLRRSRAFTIAATLTLGLGIGAATAILTVVNGVLLRPLPYPLADRALLLWQTGEAGTSSEGLDHSFSVANFVDLRARTRTLDRVAAFRTWGYTLSDERGDAERLDGSRVAPGLFEALGVEPALGRTFVSEDELADAERVVIVGDALWRRRFAADPNVVGERITLNGDPHTVIGVMPAGFTFPRGAELPSGLGFGARTELWAPMTLTEGDEAGRGTLNVAVLAIPRANTSLASVNAELVSIMSALEEEHPRTNTGLTARAIPMLDFSVAAVRRPLYVLLGAVGFLLLIACVNVSNLLLTRSAARRREWALRGALGAGRRRILRQVVTENVVLTVLGGVLGVALAAATTHALLALLPSGLPRLDDIALDWRVLALVSAIVLLAGVVLGGFAASGSGRGSDEALKVGTKDTGGRSARSLRHVMVVVEVAASVVLLVGAAVLGRTFLNLSRTDPGLSTDGVLTAEMLLPRITADITEFFRVMPEFTRFYTELTDRLAKQPGITSAAVTSALPLSGTWESASFRIAGAPTPEAGQGPSALYAGVSNDYFTAMGVPLLRGRSFGPVDAERETAGIIISESMARRYWPSGDAIGEHVSSLFGREVEIVGIVADVRHRGVDADPEPMMYLPLSLYAQPGMTLVVATAGDPGAALPIVRGTLRSLDPGVPLTEARVMRDVLARSLGEQRFSATLIGAFALAALALAIIGLHGVVTFGVARRTREIALRLALGAEERNIMRLVLAEGAALGLVGVGIGLAGAVALGRVLSGMVFGVSPTDPTTLAAVSALLMGVTVTATLLPARRALRVDPIAALKEE